MFEWHVYQIIGPYSWSFLLFDIRNCFWWYRVTYEIIIYCLAMAWNVIVGNVFQILQHIKRLTGSEIRVSSMYYLCSNLELWALMYNSPVKIESTDYYTTQLAEFPSKHVFVTNFIHYSCTIYHYLLSHKRRFRDGLIVIITNFVVVSSVGIKRVVCTGHTQQEKIVPNPFLVRKDPHGSGELFFDSLQKLLGIID